GFSKRFISSGGLERVELALTATELGYIDGRGRFFLDPGEFDIFVGGSSHTRLQTVIDLSAEQVRTLLLAKGT
ncbi:MAG: fibronectin type III-like domain-contianing protein, partial [Pseudomonadota bacterium]